MSTKTIAVESSAYQKLAAQKREGESFTKTIERLLQGHLAVQGTCGAAVEQAVQIWGGKGSAAEADRMERVVEEGRESTSWEREPLR